MIAALLPRRSATAATDGGDVAGPAEEPVVSNQAVYVSAGRALYALSKSTGARLWHKVTDAPTPVGVMGQALADGDRVLVGHGFPNLGGNWVTEAVDAATGAPWRRSAPDWSTDCGDPRCCPGGRDSAPALRWQSP